MTARKPFRSPTLLKPCKDGHVPEIAKKQLVAEAAVKEAAKKARLAAAEMKEVEAKEKELAMTKKAQTLVGKMKRQLPVSSNVTNHPFLSTSPSKVGKSKAGKPKVGQSKNAPVKKVGRPRQEATTTVIAVEGIT